MNQRHALAFAFAMCAWLASGNAWCHPSLAPVEMRSAPPSDSVFDPSIYQSQAPQAGEIPALIQIAPRRDEEEPTLLPVRNVYQRSSAYPENGEMLCGAAAITNALYYLRFYRNPPYPRIAKYSMPTPYRDQAMVQAAYYDCHVDKFQGVSAGDLRDCARSYFVSGGYPELAWLITPGADEPLRRRTPQPRDLRALVDRDAGVILLLSWFSIDQDGIYVRTGGHFVMLAGYDRREPTRFYISDPLVDYDSLVSDYDANVSALVFEQVSSERQYAYIDDDGVQQPLDLGNGPIWQTRDRFHSDLAVLQIALVLGEPSPGAASP